MKQPTRGPIAVQRAQEQAVRRSGQAVRAQVRTALRAEGADSIVSREAHQPVTEQSRDRREEGWPCRLLRAWADGLTATFDNKRRVAGIFSSGSWSRMTGPCDGGGALRDRRCDVGACAISLPFKPAHHMEWRCCFSEADHTGTSLLLHC